MHDYAKTMRGQKAYRSPARRPAAKSRRRGLGCLLVAAILVVLALPCVAVVGFQVAYGDRVYPGVTVLGIPLGGLSHSQAETLLNQRFAQRYRESLVLRYADRSWPATRDELGLRYDVPRTVKAALAVGRGGSWLDGLQEQWRLQQQGFAIQPVVDMNEVQRLGYLNRLAKEIDRPALNATVRVESGKASTVQSQRGQRLNVEATAQRLAQAFIGEGSRQVDLVVEDLTPAVQEDGVREAVISTTAILASPVILAFEDRSWVFDGSKVISRTAERTWPLDPARLAGMLSFRQKLGSDGRTKLVAGLDEDLVTAFVNTVAPDIAQPVRDARLERDAKTGSLTPIVQSQEGRAVRVAETVRLIVNAALSTQRRVNLSVQVQRPKVAMEDISKMGLVELVSEGSSIYKGSSAERTYNIQLAASRIQGVVIPPGESFSFNEAVGPVNAETGYREGYSIIGDYTVRDVGGGICQVATTFFRAVFYGGYDVLERIPHAYRIRRYEQESQPLGLDTTVYNPGVDFKFRNDGPSYLLVQTNADQAKGVLQVRFYGTKPGWTVTVEGPVLSNEIAYGPRLPDAADPTLPVGTRILVQPAENGITSTINRIIKRGNQVLRTDTFKSRYGASREQWIVGTKQ